MPNKSAGLITGSTVALGIGTIFVIAGYCMLVFWGKPTLNNAKNSVNWPTTMGKVTESKVGSHRSDGSTTYSADVTYSYTVNDYEIHSDRIWFGDNYSSSSRSVFEKIVRKYPPGKQVKVYYMPEDEFTAVLEPGAVTSSYIGFGMGLGFMVIGFGLLLVPIGSVFFGKKNRQNGHDFAMKNEF